MGAWDSSPFGNDTASDWIYELEEKGFAHIEATLRTVTENQSEYLEAPEAEEAIAAADTLARLKGNFYVKDAYTESVDEWVSQNPTPPSDEIIRLALEALDKIQAENSELRELWEEADDNWANQMSDLAARLK